MNWEAFQDAAPELAGIGRGLFEEAGVVFLGTLRADGSPRITPCEIFIVDGELLLGMMWQSRKALDLIRDPRLAIHNAHSDREGIEGDFKLYGRAVDFQDPRLRERYAQTLREKIDWEPSGPYHLFAVAIELAGFIRFGKDAQALRWDAERGIERIRHPDSDH